MRLEKVHMDFYMKNHLRSESSRLVVALGMLADQSQFP